MANASTLEPKPFTPAQQFLMDMCLEARKQGLGIVDEEGREVAYDDPRLLEIINRQTRAQA